MPRPALSVLLAGAVLAAAPASAAFDEQNYLAFADRMQTRIDRYWDDRGDWYPGMSAGAHADVLLTYAVAARRGHQGPARNDRRARRLVDLLVSSPPFVETPPRSAPQAHAPGFVSTMTDTSGFQHVVVDAEVIDGLRHAWLARRELGLSDAQADALADRIHRTAVSPFFRYPSIRLNQISWYALIYAANATVTGSPRLLRRPAQADRALRRAGARDRGGRRQPGPRPALQLPAAHARRRPDEHRLGRVREHHRIVHPRVRAGAPRGDAGAVGRRAPAAAPVADARPRRLLDPRRLPQLGHRVRLPALASVQEARALPAGAAGDRDGAEPRAAPERARVGQVDARPRLRVLRAAARPQRRRAARAVLRRPQAAAGRQQRAAGAGADELQRRPRGRRRARLGAGEGAAAAVLVRPRHRSAGDHDRRLQHGDRPHQPRRVPLRRDRPRAPVRRRPGGRLGDRRAPAGGVRALRPRRLGPSHLRVPDLRPGPPAARAGAARGRRGHLRVDRPCPRRPLPGPARGRRGPRARVDRPHVAPLHRLLRAHHLDAAAGRRARPRLGRRPVPQLGSPGRGHGGHARRRDAPGRHRADPAAADRASAGDEPPGAYVVLPWRRPRGATVHMLPTRPQSSAPLAGPTLAVQLARASGVRTARFSARYAPVTRERAAETAARLAR